MIPGNKPLSAVCCASLLFALTYLPMRKHSYSVQLSGRITLGNTWVEFHPEPYLKPDNDIPALCLALEKPYTDDFFDKGTGPNKGKGILMPDGDVINPEAEVVDQQGKVFKLVYIGAFVSGDGKQATMRYGLRHPEEFPKDSRFKVVRIKSPRPVNCRSIFWFCDSAKDWP